MLTRTCRPGAATVCYRPRSARADGSIRSTGRIPSWRDAGSRAPGAVPKTLTLYTANLPQLASSAQVFVFNMRQLDIEVDYEVVDLTTLLEKLHVRGEPWDVALLPVESTYHDPAGASHLAPPRHEVRGTDRRSEPGDGRRHPGQGLGRPRVRSHAQRPARGGVCRRHVTCTSSRGTSAAGVRGTGPTSRPSARSSATDPSSFRSIASTAGNARSAPARTPGLTLHPRRR